jgi:putative membrane protein
MSLISTILAVAVAAEFVYIFYLETIATSSSNTARVFGMEPSVLAEPHMATSMKNQGVYNLGIAVLVLLAALVMKNAGAVAALMLYIVAVAAYGSATVSKDIILKQGGLAILCLVSLLF